MRIRLLIGLSAAALLGACNGKELQPQEAKTTTYKVAVIMPQSIWNTEKPIARQALDNLATAQEGLQERVKLDLEWIDEEIPNLEEEVRRITHDPSYVAVIGPNYSIHARLVATESDLAQCQAILTVISRQMWMSRVLLLSRRDESDDYATSFNAYLPFLATELKFAKVSFCSYTDKESMREQIRSINGQTEFSKFMSGIFFVPSSLEDLLCLDQILTEEGISQDTETSFPRIYCTDLACSASIEGQLQHEYEGIALSGSPESGFPAVQRALTGKEIHSGSAQLYDSFTLLALALAHKETAKIETLYINFVIFSLVGETEEVPRRAQCSLRPAGGDVRIAFGFMIFFWVYDKGLSVSCARFACARDFR